MNPIEGQLTVFLLGNFYGRKEEENSQESNLSLEES